MKWYVGYLSSIITVIVSIILFAIQNQRSNISDEYDPFVIFAVIALISGFIGGFTAPYHVVKTAKYTSTTFTIIASVPLAIILYLINDLSADEINPLAAVILIILLIVIAIGIVITIVIVAVMLFIGGSIGAIFGKYFFKEHQYENLTLIDESNRRGLYPKR